MFFKKRSFLLIMLVVLLTVSLFIAGCGQEEEEPVAPDKDGTVVEWPDALSLGTAGIGGTYFGYGTGWGGLAADRLGISVHIEQTGGPADNMMLIHDGEMDLGMITMGIGWDAWHGVAGTAFAGNQHTNVRAIFPMYSTFSQWWAHKDSGITNVFDLEGKIVGSGPTGGTSGTFHPPILRFLGIDAEVRHGSLGDLTESHQDGMLDANSFAAGLPVSGILSYEATVGTANVVMFGIDGEAREKVMAEFPFWHAGAIPAAAYDFLAEDVETIVVFNWAVACKDLPEDLVYQIVDEIMTNNAAMLEIHGAAKETLPEAVDTNTFLPLHPGAYRWFTEHGYAVPEGAKPID